MPNKYEKHQKSKDLIANALIHLLNTYPFELITITQICQEAEVTRQTYYRNFKNKQDIFLYYCNRTLDEFLLQYPIIKTEGAKTLENLFFDPPFSKEFLSIVNKNHLEYLMTETFIEYCRIAAESVPFTYKLGSDEYNDYVFRNIAVTLLNILVVWSEHNFKESPEELLLIAIELLRPHLDQ